jgi:hypothetical protein
MYSEFSGREALIVIESHILYATDHGRVTWTCQKSHILPWIELWEVKDFNAEVRQKIQVWEDERAADMGPAWRFAQMLTEIDGLLAKDAKRPK